MQQRLSLVLNFVLLAAVVVLFIKVFGSSASSSASGTAANAADSTAVKPHLPGAGLKIAYVDTDSLNRNYRFLIDKRAEMEQEEKNIGNTLRNKMNKAQQRQQELEKNYQFMPLSDQQKAQEEVAKLAQEYAQLEQQLLGNLQNREAEINAQLYQNLYGVINAYAEEGNYDFIFSYVAGMQLLYGRQDYNITGEILSRLNEEYTRSQAR